jgi:hypothetical protein
MIPITPILLIEMISHVLIYIKKYQDFQHFST